ncbi:MAG: caspase family protein [Bacteroidetes bacterium]|nr:caspase family protein [Bacteroidota bacterium]
MTLFNTAFCQSGERGARIEYNIDSENFLLYGRKIRAVIVGVSDYESENIADLRYADDDAVAFHKWLVENTGADTSEIVLLLDSLTDPDRVKGKLYEQVKVSKPGDLVVFYYAGHGDVDTIMKNQAFLLMHKVRSNSDYFTDDGAFDIGNLIKVAELAAARNIDFLLITDACRSGRLVHSRLGAELTLTQLASEWKKVHKILSCQKDQLSMEDEKWGGGHGVFTYYLIEGLKGGADDNEDGTITFTDLKFYIENKVRMATDKKQLPELKGDDCNFVRVRK